MEFDKTTKRNKARVIHSMPQERKTALYLKSETP